MYLPHSHTKHNIKIIYYTSVCPQLPIHSAVLHYHMIINKCSHNNKKKKRLTSCNKQIIEYNDIEPNVYLQYNELNENVFYTSI